MVVSARLGLGVPAAPASSLCQDEQHQEAEQDPLRGVASDQPRREGVPGGVCGHAGPRRVRLRLYSAERPLSRPQGRLLLHQLGVRL